MATRYAQILMVIFIMLMYSGGMPLLNVLCFFAMLVIYWTEKLLILRYYRRPPHYNDNLYMSAIRKMYVALVVHALISAYMYGSPDIFREEGTDQNLEYRYITSTAGIAMVLIVVGVLVVYGLSWLILKVCKACLKKMHFQVYSKEKRRLDEVLPEINKRSIGSYEISKHPKYTALIQAINETAQSPTRIAEERKVGQGKARVAPIFEDSKRRHDSKDTALMDQFIA